MFDQRTERNLATLNAEAASAFRKFIPVAQAEAALHGCTYVAIGGSRTWDEQNALYAKGRTAPGPKVTNARAGFSWHNFGIALDFGVFKDGKYLDESNPKLAEKVHRACGALASTYNLEWGGTWKNFTDLPHYQLRVDKTLAQMRAEHNK